MLIKRTERTAQRRQRAALDIPEDHAIERRTFLRRSGLAAGGLAALGIERAAETSEPEDHAAILCEIMAGLIGGQFSAPLEQQRQFQCKHLAPWIGRFFADLEGSKVAQFYRPVGTIGRLFIAIETAAFALPG